MEACSELGEVLEKHLGGAAEPAEETRATAHLASCADCRDYVQRARRIETELASQLSSLPAPDQRWPHVQARLTSHRRGRVAMGSLALTCVSLAAGEALGALGDSERDRIFVAASLLVMAALLVFGVIQDGQSEARARQRDLFDWARGRARRERWGATAMVGWFGATALVAGIEAVRSDDAARWAWGLMGVVQAVTAVFCLRRVGAIRRELQVLA